MVGNHKLLQIVWLGLLQILLGLLLRISNTQQGLLNILFAKLVCHRNVQYFYFVQNWNIAVTEI